MVETPVGGHGPEEKELIYLQLTSTVIFELFLHLFTSTCKLNSYLSL